MKSGPLQRRNWYQRHLSISDAPAGSRPARTVIDPPQDAQSRLPLLLAAGVAVLVVAWAAAIFAVPQIRFAVVAPRAQVGVEAAAAFARLFGALVLFLVPVDRGGRRLRWVAAGFVVLALGGLVFGYVLPLLGVEQDQNTAIYESLVVRSIAGALFVCGLVSGRPLPFSRQAMIIVLAVFGGLGTVAAVLSDSLPALAHIPNLEAAATRGDTPLPGLTPWHWALSSVPLALAITAAGGAARHRRVLPMGSWLLVAMVLLAGSQLHGIFWPSIYSPVLTTADLLRLAFAAVVAVGGVVELRRIAAERAALLAVEQENSQRLRELAVLKADFTAMVAHELGSPLAAIRGFADMLGFEGLNPAQRAQALASIQAEAGILTGLVVDVQSASSIERDDFSVRCRPVPLDVLLADAAAFANTLPGQHPLTVTNEASGMIWADPDRLLQVLRNLLSNAAKYSSEGTPIELRARCSAGRVRIEVADHGYGIHPDDLARIFEKFGRGRDQSGRKVAGVGLGLYLSRRIVQTHGFDLIVTSSVGAGSVFGFDVEAAR